MRRIGGGGAGRPVFPRRAQRGGVKESRRNADDDDRRTWEMDGDPESEMINRHDAPLSIARSI